MRRIDIWKSDRDQAEILPCGLKLKRGRMGDGRPHFLLWKPKATNPRNVCFRNDDHAERWLAEQIASFEGWKAATEKSKQARLGTPEQIDAVKVGDIFHWSWGWEQTNCDFFQITEKHGRNVVLRKIAAQTVPGSDNGGMCDSRVAVKDAFDDEKPIKRRIAFANGGPYVPMKYGWCSLWDGKPALCSWYA